MTPPCGSMGQEVARHRGGFTPFTARSFGGGETGRNRDARRARARLPRPAKPRGKQSAFTTTTAASTPARPASGRPCGWSRCPDALPAPAHHPRCCQFLFHLELPITGSRPGMTVRAALNDDRGEIARASLPADLDFAPALELAIPASRVQLWQPGNPYLYNLTLELVNSTGQVIDRIGSPTPGCARCALTAREFCSTGSLCSSAWCWTRVITPTAS